MPTHNRTNDNMKSEQSRSASREFPGSLVVMTPHLITDEGPGSIPGQGTKIPQAMRGTAKKSKKLK